MTKTNKKILGREEECRRLERCMDVPEMINQEKGVDMPEWMVPQTILYLWENDKIVGQFRIRHYLTEALRNGAGHIGHFFVRIANLGKNRRIHLEE